MFVVIFKAKLLNVDQPYYDTAQALRKRAFEFGCYHFESYNESGREITLSYWPDRDSINRWGQDSEHTKAQARGMAEWYAEHSVEIAELETSNRFIK